MASTRSSFYFARSGNGRSFRIGHLPRVAVSLSRCVHAGAALKRFEELIKPVNIEDEGNENGEKGETESSWFAPKKRALLAGRGQKGSIGGTRLAYKTCASSVPGIVAVSILDDFPYGLGTMGTLSII